MPKKLTVPNQRMLKLMAWCIESKKVKSETEFCKAIGFTHSNLTNIKQGHQSFTLEYIINACRFTGANANWILGIESNMMRKPSRKLIEQLREMFISIEVALKKTQ